MTGATATAATMEPSMANAMVNASGPNILPSTP